MVLVITALEETFPKDKNEKILFLGEWSKLYSRKKIYEQYKYETMPYHWDDRKKLFEDTKRIDEIYEIYLVLLKDNLNKIHKVDFSVDYWRIILGPWLRYFIEMVYDRYLSILNVSKYDIDYVNLINIQNEDVLPNNMKDFGSLYINDLWNQFVYQEIISYFDIKTKNIDIEINDKIIFRVEEKPFKSKIKEILSILNKYNSIHFISSYMGLTDRIKLQLSLGQTPNMGININVNVDCDYSEEFRNSLIFGDNSFFDKILGNLIKKQIPKYYLEGYSKFRYKVLEKYPKKVNVVFTSNSYSADDPFKFWAAEKKELGAKYIIGQHGGNYGMGLFASHELHQIKSSDKFFSWGWTIKNNDKVIPVSAIKLKQKILYNPKGDILVPLIGVPRYSYHLFAKHISGQLLSYLNDQIEYLKLLNIELKDLVKFRLARAQYGWNLEDRIVDLGYEQNIDSTDNHKKTFYERLSECRLCIGTYNATTYLETFSANYPTLLYWDPHFWELNDDSKPFFKLLEDVGILHYTVESLSEKLNDIYENPMRWWKQIEVQNAKDTFCDKYANTDKDFIDDYKNNINKLHIRYNH